MKYLYEKIQDYLSIRIQPGDSVVEVDSVVDLPRISQGLDYRKFSSAEANEPGAERREGGQSAVGPRPDFVLINGAVHYWRDVQERLEELSKLMGADSRLLIVYYSSLWRPLIALAQKLGWRQRRPEMNWLAPEDVRGMAELAGYESISDEARILVPVRIPLLSELVNRYVAPWPVIRWFCLIRLAIFRRATPRWPSRRPSVSVVIPARNEAGNIEQALQRTPLMGPEDELIFVEGNSSDDTWERIRELVQREEYRTKWDGRIKVAQQEGRGKGDAVRKGFAMADKDILMILDADLTVPPEELPKFYAAMVADRGEFINGSRLVYPMDQQAMRFFNILGNKFFAMAFSQVLGARFKDTLCGTKVMARRHYEKLAARRQFFGNFDPFGDFDLIFGATRMGLKIVELPIRYRERVYGETNISRWRHGAILFGMLLFAARRLKFV